MNETDYRVNSQHQSTVSIGSVTADPALRESARSLSQLWARLIVGLIAAADVRACTRNGV